MKPLSIVLIFCFLLSSARASYYETWLLDAEILEVFDEEETAEILEKRRDIQFDKNRIAMKVRTTKCEYVEGHGRNLCKEGQVSTIVLSFKKEPEQPFQPGATLRIRYFFSNSRVPAGEEGNSHVWYLLEDSEDE